MISTTALLVQLAGQLFARHDGAMAQSLAHDLAELPVTDSRSAPAQVAACHVLDILDPRHTDPIVAQLIAARNDLSWREPGFGRLPAQVAAQIGVVELVGPDGMVHSDDLRCGLLIQDAGADYPSHHHAAEELYVILAGSGEWSVDGGRLVQRHAGDVVHHLPWQPHAMRTGDEPMLALWGWRGDIGSASYSA